MANCAQKSDRNQLGADNKAVNEKLRQLGTTLEQVVIAEGAETPQTGPR